MLLRAGRRAFYSGAIKPQVSQPRPWPTPPGPLRHAVPMSTTNPQSEPQQPPSTAAQSTSTTTTTPIEDAIRAKLTASLHPTRLTIANDSHRHAHHAAMQAPAYAAARETHFRVHIVSDDFKGKMQPARHRMVYRLLQDEMQREGGVHALQLVTRTADEEDARDAAT